MHPRTHHELASTVALVMACMVSSACTAWHPTTLQPERFSADTSPDQVRLTLNDDTRLTTGSPVITGDSLVMDGSSRDPGRSAIPTSTIRKVELHGVDAPRTIALLAFLGGVVLGVRALVVAYVRAIDD
jgi:hypothetical protein